MRRHIKSRFQMLRHKRLNEVIATDTYFANATKYPGLSVVSGNFETGSKYSTGSNQ
jgi:hypothetical protein